VARPGTVVPPGNGSKSERALDLPGQTWRDRAAVSRGDGVWLVGDWVAAPGIARRCPRPARR
jgi:hypothetical protein